MRRAFLYWRTLLAFGDLQGADRRPSRTTLAAVCVIGTGCAVVLLNAAAALVSARSVDATFTSGHVGVWDTLWTFGGLLLLWNRWRFARFADKITRVTEERHTVEADAGGTHERVVSTSTVASSSTPAPAVDPAAVGAVPGEVHAKHGE